MYGIELQRHRSVLLNTRWDVLDNAILTVDIGLDLTVRVDHCASLDEQRATISLRERERGQHIHI